MITCANCQTQNPDSAQTCENCGQPLTTNDAAEVTPTWLRNLLHKYGQGEGVLAGVTDTYLAPPSEMEPGDPAADISDVLQDIAHEAPKPQTGRLASSVDWGPAAEPRPPIDPSPVDDVLAGFQEKPAGPEPTDNYNAEDWLSELVASTPSEPKPMPPPPPSAASEPIDESSETPDWLDELTASSSTIQRTESAPPPTNQPTSDTSREIPDWLRDAGSFETEAADSGQSDFEFESSSDASASDDPRSTSSEDDAPDWLSGLGLSTPTPGQETTQVPDWLVEFAASDELSRPQPTFESEPEPPVEPEPPPTPARPHIEIPDWLAELDATREAQAASPYEPPTPQQEEAISPSSEADTDADALDWMANLGLDEADDTPSESTAAPSGPMEVETTFSFDQVDQDQPDQFDASDDEPADIADPDTTWLAELAAYYPDDPSAQAEETTGPLYTPASSAVEADDDLLPADFSMDTMPDWLKSSWDESPSDESSFAGDEESAGAGLPTLPDWLTDSADQEPVEEAAADPDWLTALRPEEDQIEPDEDEAESAEFAALPSWLVGAEEDEAVTEKDTVSAEVEDNHDATDLDWLATLRLSGDQADVDEPEAEATEFATMPSWLAKAEEVTTDIEPESALPTEEADEIPGLDWLTPFDEAPEIDLSEAVVEINETAETDIDVAETDDDEPEWLRLATADADNLVISQPEEAAGSSEWLSSLQAAAAEESEEEEETEASAIEPETDFSFEADLEVETSTPEIRSASPAHAPGDTLPVWLRALEDEAQHEGTASLSEWLNQMKQIQADSPSAVRRPILAPAEPAPTEPAIPPQAESPEPYISMADLLASEQVEAERVSPEVVEEEETSFSETVAAFDEMSVESTNAADVPDWLAELPTESGEVNLEAEAAPAVEDVPDWLAELPTESGEVNLEVETVTPIEDVPDWMQEQIESASPLTTFDEPEETPLVEDVPDWMKTLDEGETPTGDTLVEDSDSSDWLANLRSEARPVEETTIADEVEETPLVEDMPDWMKEIEAEPAATSDEDSEDSDSPDWFANLRTEAQPVEETSVADEIEETSLVEDMPDWMKEIEAEPMATSDEISEDSDAPDWFANLRSEAQPIEETALVDAPEEALTEDMPDWMKEIEAEPAAPDEDTEEAETPDWFASLRAGAASIEEDVTADEAEETPLVEDVPDWMKELDAAGSTAQPSEPASETDWLNSLRGGVTEAEDTDETADATPLAEDVPDWMKDIDSQALQPDKPTLPDAADDDASDWLSKLRSDPAVVEDFNAEEAESVEDIPDWMQTLATPEADETTTGQSTLTSDDEPDWLTTLRTGDTADTTADEAATGDEDLPFAAEDLDWIRSLGPQSGQSDPFSAATEDDDTPDWLNNLQTDSVEAEADEPALSEVVPDWMKYLDEDSTDDEDQDDDDDDDNDDDSGGPGPSDTRPWPPDQQADSFDFDIPDWMQELDDTAKPPQDPAPFDKKDDDVGPVSWIESDEIAPLLTFEDSSQVQPEDEIAAADLVDELPPWMQGLEAEDQEPAPPLTPSFETELEAPQISDPTSAEATSEAKPAEEVETNSEVESGSGLGRLSQLAQSTPARKLRPVEDKPAADGPLDWMLDTLADTEDESLAWIFNEEAEADPFFAPDSPMLRDEAADDLTTQTSTETESTVDQLTEALTASPQGRTGPASGSIPSLLKSGGIGVTSTAAQTFFNIATAVPDAPALPEKAEREVSLSSRIIRAALNFSFLVLIALPLFFPQVQNGAASPWLKPFPDEQELIQNSLQGAIGDKLPGSVALVSFDYTPATEGEMKPLALQVVRKLRGQDVRIIGMTLEPEGQGVIEDVFKQIGSEADADRFVNIGYQPGGMLAVRRLAYGALLNQAVDLRTGQPYQNLTDWPTINGTNGIDLIVEISATADSARWWAEQMAVVVGPPKLAAVSAAAEPFVWPYVNSGQYTAMVAGIRAAAAIEAERVQPTLGPASRMLDSQSVAHLTIMILMLAGTVAGWLTKYGQETA